MDEKTKNNKLNESEMDEISGGANGKNLKKILDDIGTLPPPPIFINVKYGYPPNWPPKKNPEQSPTDPVKPKDTTDNTIPKVDPNSEKKL